MNARLSPRPHRGRLAVVGLLLAALLTPPALAVPPAVERLYDEGKASLQAEEPAVALGRFKDALSQAKGDHEWTWRLLLAVALTYKIKDEPQHAIEYFYRFLAQTEAHKTSMRMKWRDRREVAQRDLVTLEKQVEETHGFVNVESTPNGAQISVDGTRAGADGDATTPFMLILLPGEHLVRVTQSGHIAAEQRVTVRVGSSQPLSLVLAAEATESAPTPEPEPAPEKAEAAPAAETPPPPSEPTGEETVADAGAPIVVASTSTPGEPSIVPWVAMGASAAVAVSGVVLTILASEEAKKLEAISNDPLQTGSPELGQQWTKHANAVETYQLAAGVLYGVAAAGLTAGLVLMLLDDPGTEAEPPSPMPALQLSPTPGGLVGRATWRF